VRRPLDHVAVVVAVALTAACQDKSVDGLAIINHSDTDVVVNIVDGTEIAVESGHRKVVPMDSCLGTSVIVTAEAHDDVEMPGAVCVAEVLYVREDHTAYVAAVFG